MYFGNQMLIKATIEIRTANVIFSKSFLFIQNVDIKKTTVDIPVISILESFLLTFYTIS